jgi:hypothetical protein
MGYLDWLFGTLWGMLDSPITFVTIVLAFSLGLWRKEWWIPILVALIADGATVLILYKHWQRIEIDVTTQALQGALLFAVFTYLAFAFGRLLIVIHSRTGGDGSHLE